MRRRKSELVRTRDGFTVTVIPIAGATRLLTWDCGLADVLKLPPSESYQGAIVKIIPSAAMTPEQREAVRRQLLDAGAAHAWLAPRAVGADAVNRKPRVVPSRIAVNPRTIIERMVEEAHTKDRTLLAEVVDEAITQEGM